MSKRSDTASRYQKKFEDLVRAQKSGQIYAYVALALFMAAAFATLYGLSPSKWATAYVLIFLIAPGAWGFDRLWRIRQQTIAALNHLQETGKQVAKGDADTELKQFIDERRDSDDESHVPEAISHLRVSDRSVLSIQSTAEACFIYPLSHLATLGFFRTLLVLAGLFGTVLFFGLGLEGGVEDLARNPDFLTDLRGALTSTLLGVLGSAMIGVMSGHFQSQLDQAVTETESFLGEVIAPILALEPPQSDIDSETDLWEALRSEVKEMTRAISNSHDSLVDQRVEHLTGMTAIVTAIETLPELRVPPALSKLETTIERFSHSAEIIDEAVKTLVNTAGIINVLSPAAVVSQLDELREHVDQLSNMGTEALEKIGHSSVALDKGLTDLRELAQELPTLVTNGIKEELQRWHESSMTIVSTIKEDVAAVREAASQLGPRVSRLADENGELGRSVAVLADSGEKLGTEVNQMSGSIHALNTEVKRFGKEGELQSKALVGEVSGLRNHSERVGQELSGVRASLSAMEELFVGVNEMGANEDTRIEVIRVLRDLDQRLHSTEAELSAVASQLDKFGRSESWISRAENAPLMRLLTLPLWLKGRIPFVPGTGRR